MAYFSPATPYRSGGTYVLDSAAAGGRPKGDHEKPILRNTVMLSFVRELSVFLVQRRKFWLLPIVLMMALLGGLMLLTEGSVISPFVYSIF